MVPPKGSGSRRGFERDYPASDTFAELKIGSPQTTIFQASHDAPPTLTLHSRGNPDVIIHNTHGRPPDKTTFDAITADLITLGIAPDQSNKPEENQ